MFPINIDTALPSLEYCLVFDNGKWELIYGQFEENSLDFKELDSYIKSFKDDTLWLDSNSISADIRKRNLQLDLLGHSNEPAFILRSPQQTESSKSQYYLIKLKLFTTPEDLYYGRDQKRLIEQIIKLWINSLNHLQPAPEDRKLNFKYIVVNQSNKINQLNEDLSNSDFFIYKTLHQLFLYILRDELIPDQKISLTKETIEWFKTYKGDILSLETQIKDAFEISKALYPTHHEFVIKDYYFMPEKVEEPILKSKKINEGTELAPKTNEELNPETVKSLSAKQTPSITNFKAQSLKRDITTRLEKTVMLLDRYEQAVKRLITQGIPVLGKNIAQACDPPISAPALTDSINKHKDRIGLCMQQYPDKWQLLRANYQVIKNILL